MPLIFVSELEQHWFRYRLVAFSAPSHYLNQCSLIINWTFRDKLKWNLNQKTKFFIAKWRPLCPRRDESTFSSFDFFLNQIHITLYLCHLVFSLGHIDSDTHGVDTEPGEHQQDGHDEATELQEAARDKIRWYLSFCDWCYSDHWFQSNFIQLTAMLIHWGRWRIYASVN